jgi:parallel beta-helix repeat protein
MKRMKVFLTIALLIGLVGITMGITALATGAEQPPTVQLNPPRLLEPGSSSAPGPTVDTLTPVFRWEGVANAERYALAIWVEPYGPANVIYQNENLTGRAFTLPSGILTYGNKYRWNMQARDSAGWSEFSAALYFQTPPAPAAPAPPVGRTITVQPRESIQRAIDRAPVDAVICLAEGKWEEDLEITKSLTLRALEPEKSVVWGGITICSPEKIHVGIEGLEIIRGRGHICIEGSAEATIEACTVSRGGGIKLRDFAQATIIGCTMSRNKEQAIELWSSAQATIEGCAVSENERNGPRYCRSAKRAVQGEMRRAKFYLKRVT